jgi:hypothetical protein
MLKQSEVIASLAELRDQKPEYQFSLDALSQLKEQATDKPDLYLLGEVERLLKAQNEVLNNLNNDLCESNLSIALQVADDLGSIDDLYADMTPEGEAYRAKYEGCKAEGHEGTALSYDRDGVQSKCCQQCRIIFIDDMGV